MRTTLTLDDDLADALKERARLLEKPLKQVINDTLRRGLSPAPQEERAVFEVKPICSGLRPGIDPLKLNQLYGELETADFLSEQERDRS